jgi:DNA-directed RNA polymerase subunit RPC12/RpoP
MALGRGLSALKKAASAVGGKGASTWSFRLADRETALIRVFGDFESAGDESPDPVIAKEHTCAQLSGHNMYQWCGENAPDDTHAGCTFCYISNAQNDAERKSGTGIKTSNVALIEIKDYRLQHKLENEVTVGGIKTKYPTCTGPKKPCQFCKLGNEARPRGFTYWKLANKHCQVLLEKRDKIRDFCLCGAKETDGSGTIGIASYQCADCEREVTPDAQGFARCASCKTTNIPKENLFCSSETCYDPVRATIQDVLFSVTRIGADTATTYTFDIQVISPPTAEELELAEKYKPDWLAITAPKSSEEQAILLGLLESPFRTEGHGAKPFGSSGTESGRIQASKPNLSNAKPFGQKQNDHSAFARKQTPVKAALLPVKTTTKIVLGRRPATKEEEEETLEEEVPFA